MKKKSPLLEQLLPFVLAAAVLEAAFLMVFAGSLPDGSAGMVMAGWRVLTYYFILLAGVGLLALTNDNKSPIISAAPTLNKFSFDTSSENSL